MSFFFALASQCLVSFQSHTPHRTRTPRACLGEDGTAAAAELAVLSLPAKPSPCLTPEAVIVALCRGLQYNNVPTRDAGLRRLYEFCTYECRASLTSRKGYKSGPDRFVEKCVPNMWTLVGATAFALSGEPTINAGTATRGSFAVAAVDVTETLGFRFASGHERGKTNAETHTERYRWVLQQQRLPPSDPLAGCWMVQSVLPMRQHVLFDGDSGAVQG